MRRALLLAFCCLAWPALAQAPRTPRSEVPAAPPPQWQGPSRAPVDAPASRIEGPVDEAFAAYQQGRYLTALHLATARAETGDRAAMTLLGEIYLRGLGVSPDAERAANWYRLAADRGDREAQATLGVLYARGEGVLRSTSEAVRLLEQAAEAGHSLAAYNAGLVYLEADPPDYAAAARWFGRASENGNRDAIYALAQLTRTGQGVPPDQRRATTLLREAGERGLLEAQVEYAIRLFRGEGAAADEAEALDWFRRAAQRGNAIAQNRLARILFAGRVIARDPPEAARWHLIARASGLDDPELDHEMLLLTRAERAEADRRVAIWFARQGQ
jgi:TPR repeat protein